MKFLGWTLFVLLALYGLVFVLGDILLLRSGVSIWFGIAFAVAITGFQFLIAPWLIERMFSIDFETDALPVRYRQFIERICVERGLPMPKLGVIHSGNPNAFAFGHTRRDARIVVTSGLLEILNEEEVEAVLAHELGHIEHYDFAVMGIAALAPLLLYQIYIWTDRSERTRVIALGAYAAYWVGQFMVLQLNRTREYYADHYSACITHAPANLSSALVKIAYGMVRAEGDFKQSLQNGSGSEKKAYRRAHRLGGAIAIMGISNLRSGTSLALASANPEQAASIMRWDLQSPWARIYELASTHPLTALRVRALNREAQAQHLPVEYPLPETTEGLAKQWASFPLEFALWATPVACGILLIWHRTFHELAALLHLQLPSSSTLLVTAGLTWTARILYRYRGSIKDAKVADLLPDLEVSQMRPRAVRLQGEIVGRGVPGAFWSPDLVLRDETGLLFVLNRQTIPFARLFFAIGKADRFIGEHVRVEGWYRRGLSPYIELSKIETTITPELRSDAHSIFSPEVMKASEEREEIVHRSYSRWLQLAGAAAITAVGLLSM